MFHRIRFLNAIAYSRTIHHRPFLMGMTIGLIFLITTANVPKRHFTTRVVSKTTQVPVVVPLTEQSRWKQSGLANQDIHTLVATDRILLAGTSEGIFRSPNEGTDWLMSSYGLPIVQKARRAIALMKITDSTYLAGTDGAGVWGSDIGARAWTTTEFTRPTARERVLSLTSTARMFFAGTGGNGVFRQVRDPRDGPPLWSTAGLNGQTITAMGASGDRVFAGTRRNGLFSTTNNGETWTKIKGGLPANAQINVLDVNGQTIYTATATRLWRSKDAGLSWSEVKLPINTAIKALLQVGSAIFLGTMGKGVLISRNDGTTWKSFNTGLTNRKVLSLLNFGGRLYAGTRGGGIFVTPLVPDSNLPPVADPQTVALDEDTSLPVKLTGSDPNGDPLNYQVIVPPKHGFLSGDSPDVTYRPSENYFGPDSFSFLAYDGKAHSRLATVMIDVRPVNDPLQLSIEGDNSTIVGGLIQLFVRGLNPDGGKVKVMARSLPAGARFEPNNDLSPAVVKWVPASAGTYLFSFTATAENKESSTIEYSVNIDPMPDTKDWSQVPLFIDKRVEDILVDGATIYLSFSGADSDPSTALLRSTNNGIKWEQIGNGLPGKYYLSRVVNGGTALYVSTSQGAYRSADGGMTWGNISSGKGLPEDGKNLIVAAQGDKLLAHNHQRIYLSLNAGGAWTDLTDNLPTKPNNSAAMPGGLIHSVAVSSNALLVSFSSGIVPSGPVTFRSTNNGASWQSANKGLADLASIVEFITDGENLYGLAPFHLHLSNDHGATWRPLNPMWSSNRPQVTPNIAAAVNKDLILVVYREGGIYASQDKGVTWTQVDARFNDEIRQIAVGSLSLFAVTSSGKLFIKPRN